jgi:glycosyltransferase involved in cell wall biosynthesis
MIDVSIIIPTYNRAGILPGLLESWRKVAGTTRCSFEIIFSDDGSDDGTAALLEGAGGLPSQSSVTPTRVYGTREMRR